MTHRHAVALLVAISCAPDLGRPEYLKAAAPRASPAATAPRSLVAGEFNVRDFGAVGDGVNDDTTALQAALDAPGADGGEVYIPAGQYRITSGLAIPPRVRVRGVQKAAWYGDLPGYDGGTALVPRFAGDVVTISGVVGHETSVDVENITILGDKSRFPTGNGFVLNDASGCTFRNVRVSRVGGHGFVTGNGPTSFHNYFYQCYAFFCGGSGWEVRSDWLRLVDSWADGCNIGVHFPALRGGTFFHIMRLHAEENTRAGIKIDGGYSDAGSVLKRASGTIVDSIIFSRPYEVGTPLHEAHGLWIDTSLSGAGACGLRVQDSKFLYESVYVHGARPGTRGVLIGAGAQQLKFLGNEISGFDVNLDIGINATDTTFTGNTINGWSGSASVLNASNRIRWFDNVFVSSPGTYSIQQSNVDTTVYVGNAFDKPPDTTTGVTNVSAISNPGWAIGVRATGLELAQGALSPSTDALEAQPGRVFQGSGTPSSGNGSDGDVYFRTDTPATPGQRIYMKSGGAWISIL